MKKRILAILLTLCMVLSMATTVFAAEGEVVTNEAELTAALANGGEITLGDDIALAVSLNITKDTIIDLNGNSIIGTDNSTGSFGLIKIQPGVELTIDDSMGDGKITLTATNDRSTGAYSSVISNQRGKLTVLDGTIEHLGGTYMAYAIDNLTNGKGTYAETVIEGGTIKSTYRAIRQFLNGTEAQNILTVNGGTIEGGNKAIWMQDSNVNANPGTLTVGEDATLKGNVFLSVTKNSTEWPVSISIAEDVFEDGYTVEGNSNIPEDSEIKAIGGYWGIADVGTAEPSVAAVKGVCYPTLQAAIDAAGEGDTVILLSNVTLTEGVTIPADKTVTIDLNGKTVRGVNTTASSTALITNNGTLTIKDSTATTNADGVYVSGKLTTEPVNPDTSEVPGYASNTISNNGTLTVESGIIENTANGGACYAIDSYAGSTTNINGGKITASKTAVRIYSWQGTGVKVALNITDGMIESEAGYGVTTQIAAGDNFDLSISGGSITTSRTDYPLAVYVNPAGSIAGSTINITGGTFGGDFAMKAIACTTMAENGVSISGGTFAGIVCYGTPAYGFVTGGTFAEAPEADYIAEGYVLESYVNKDGETVYGVEPEVTVTFNAGEGTGTMDEVVMPAGEYTLPECGFTAPENYTFKAWRIGDAEYAAGDVVEIEENTIVTAVYAVKLYEVVFKNGDEDVTARLVEHGGDVELPAVPKKEGYTGAWDHDGKNITADTTINAVYTINKYTVIFKADDDVIDTVEVEHGKDVTLPEVPAKDGYTGEWDNDGKGITADTVIKAVYTEASTVVPDGSGSEDSDTETEGSVSEDPDTETEGSGSGTTGTGDSSNIVFWIVLMIISVAAAGMIIVAASRKRNAGSKN